VASGAARTHRLRTAWRGLTMFVPTTKRGLVDTKPTLQNGVVRRCSLRVLTAPARQVEGKDPARQPLRATIFDHAGRYAATAE
jgi:hypothetical protein